MAGAGKKQSHKEIEKSLHDVHIKKFKRRRRRKHKRQKNGTELDEASRLQRRVKYLLIKMKLEQNLIDAYSMEGWKGQSREKIKPQKELERAKKQILNCKLGIRDAIHQLDGLSSVGHIEDSAIAPDGSVHHEHIICAKCKSREAFPDNDIILCDGMCNCAFHQKCLDPPLSTENIPPGDQGWLCKYCDCKMDIIEAMNAHIGTNFPLDCNWQDIFKEEAALPNGEQALQHPEQEWPSDDSEDDDYDPDKFGSSHSDSQVDDYASVDGSTSGSLWSLENEVLSEFGRSEKRTKGSQNNSLAMIVRLDSDETSDCEIISGRRQRKAVDYLKLNDVLFGKNAAQNEQISEDEDWGPTTRKRREKESDAASTLMTLCASDKNGPDMKNTDTKQKSLGRQTRRSFSRFPPNAVEKLRHAFAENELPPRAVKENLSKQLGINSEKVNKWFKNARYLALKARKLQAERAEPFQDITSKISNDYGSEDDKENSADQLASNNVSLGSFLLHKPKNFKKFCRRKETHSFTSTSRKKRHRSAIYQSQQINNKEALDFGEDVSLKVLREKAKIAKKRGVLEAEAEMERLCKIKGKVEKLQQVLLCLPICRANKALPLPKDSTVIYVPLAELREKA